MTDTTHSKRSDATAHFAEGEPFLRAFLESVVFLFAVRAAEPIFFGDSFYATLAVHPFWIVVVLAAVQNGLYAGVATAAMAALMMDWPPRPVGVDITDHFLDLATLPVLWILTAIVLGGFRQTQMRETARLRRDNARLTQMNEDISTEVLRMDALVARLELALATREEATDAETALRALRELGEAEDDTDLAARLEAAATTCGLAERALFAGTEDGRFVRVEPAPAWLGTIEYLDAGAEPLADLRERVACVLPADSLLAGATGSLAVCRVGRSGRSARLIVARVADETTASATRDMVALLMRQVELAPARQGGVPTLPPLDLAPYSCASPRLEAVE